MVIKTNSEFPDKRKSQYDLKIFN